MPDPKVISVTRLVRRMKNLLEIELGELWVEGEISNIRKQASGHQYFTLKDKGGQIPCVLFRGNASKLTFELEDGMQVMLFAEASLYEARGQVQLIVRKVEQQGQGDLQRQFEELKVKLSKEGLFDQQKKQLIPAFPCSIGFITSGTSAALQDMLNILKRRAAWVQPYLYDVQVQGKGAEKGIADAINEWNQDENLPAVDVLIVGRGGGSIEDLWNFNEEVVARAMADSDIPVISAVGHEIDFTIADLVADLRAPTPSAAVELAVPDGAELKRKLEVYQGILDRGVSQLLENSKLKVESLKLALSAKSPDSLLREYLLKVNATSDEMEVVVNRRMEKSRTDLELLTQRLSNLHPEGHLAHLKGDLEKLSQRLDKAVRYQFEKQQQRLETLRGLHRTLGPDKAFSRGFSVTRNANGEIIKSKDLVNSGDLLVTSLRDGEVQSEVK